jgi:hypothetical protein
LRVLRSAQTVGRFYPSAENQRGIVKTAKPSHNAQRLMSVSEELWRFVSCQGSVVAERVCEFGASGRLSRTAKDVATVGVPGRRIGGGRRTAHAPGVFVSRWHCVRGRRNGAPDCEHFLRPGLKWEVAVGGSRSFWPQREHRVSLRSRRFHAGEASIDGVTSSEVSIQR